MRKCLALSLFVLLLMIVCACGRLSEFPPATGTPPATESSSTYPQAEPTPPRSMGESPAESAASEVDNDMTSITLTIGGFVFPAKLYDNDAATAFLERLPMTLNMSELNGNEKYCYLPDSLPTDSRQVGSIHTGDLMVYGSDCLVLFYQSFTTSYSYTKLGYVEDVAGLAEALGRGSVEIAFTLSD